MKTAFGRERHPRVRGTELAVFGTCLFGIFVGIPPHAFLSTASIAGASQQGLTFVAGPDGSAPCVNSPCASTEVTSSGGAQISLTLGRESRNSPQPETYYTDLLQLTNPTSAPMVVSSVALTDVSESRAGDIGAITVFYCAVQTDDTRTCRASFTTSDLSGGMVFSGADTLQPGATRYIELAGFASPVASDGDTVSFVVEVTA